VTLADELVAALASARAVTDRLTSDLAETSLLTQYDPDFSPIAWHLGHIAWQEECFALRRLGGCAPIDGSLDALYNTFESKKSTRADRLPDRRTVTKYANEVRERATALIHGLDEPQLTRVGHVFRFLANHERQHAETIGVVRLLGELFLEDPDPVATSVPAREPGFVPIAGGEWSQGCNDDPDGWDNERRSHPCSVHDFELARYPVRCAEWLEFMDAGGYATDRWWTDRGIRWRESTHSAAPHFWRKGCDGHWWNRDLTGEHRIRASDPVTHVSWYEADAYAKFRAGRLPTEPEWELAASWDRVHDRKRRWPWGDEPSRTAARLAPAPGPAPVDQHPMGAAASGVQDLVGNAWEWTSCDFAPYPGFVPQDYRGYSEPWFDGRHKVCRGGSYLTQPEVARCTFRNFFLPGTRAIPLGLRLARDP
jgi:iron(II)-dependent oxidoreductase